MAITTLISDFPSIPASTDTASVFNSKSDAYTLHQANTYITEMNAWAVEANSLETDVDAAASVLPSGTVSDGAASLTNTYSSKKIVELISLAGGGAVPFVEMLTPTIMKSCVATSWAETNFYIGLFKKALTGEIYIYGSFNIGAETGHDVEAKFMYSTDGGANWINLSSQTWSYTNPAGSNPDWSGAIDFRLTHALTPQSVGAVKVTMFVRCTTGATTAYIKEGVITAYEVAPNPYP